jgi:hypothetical protein
MDMFDKSNPQRETPVLSGTGAAQVLSETLANIDFVHAREMDRVLASGSAPEAKQLALAVLECRHHERRQAYVQALTELSRRDARERPGSARKVAVVT